MFRSYYPAHHQNRMKQEGNVEAARSAFLTGKNVILYNLVRNRFTWMNQYINDSDKVVIELGCGAGLSKLFIENPNLILSDVVDHEWVDKYVDAMNIECDDESIDVVICSHMIHHLSNPANFFDALWRKLKPDGRIIIQDIYTCLLMKAVLRIMRHEGWSEDVDVFDRNSICNDPHDPWSANCSIPKLLFFNEKTPFDDVFAGYNIVKKSRNECFLFLLSGGVIAKTFYLPANNFLVKVIKTIDRFLIALFPAMFACGCSVVIQKRNDIK